MYSRKFWVRMHPANTLAPRPVAKLTNQVENGAPVREDQGMANITFDGDPVSTRAQLPPVGVPAPEFTVVNTDLENISLSDFEGPVVLNIFPSLDTGICANSVRAFNERAASLKGVTVLNISRDLPFAQSRFCGAEGIDDVYMDVPDVVLTTSMREHQKYFALRRPDGSHHVSGPSTSSRYPPSRRADSSKNPVRPSRAMVESSNASRYVS